jgi:DNA-binding CsgD family transcriptional regulator
MDHVMSLVFRFLYCRSVTVSTVYRPAGRVVQVTWRPGVEPGVFDIVSERRSGPGRSDRTLDVRPLFVPVLESREGSEEAVLSILVERTPDRVAWVTLHPSRSYDVMDCALASLLVARLPISDDSDDINGQLASERLTGRQIEILGHLGRGLTAKAIAHRCGISARTVHKHLEHIYQSLDCHDKVTAVLAAQRAGLLAPTAPGTDLPVPA